MIDTSAALASTKDWSQFPDKENCEQASNRRLRRRQRSRFSLENMAAALTETWVSRIGVVTIGFPFVAFKLLFGLTLVQTIQGLPAALVGYSLLLLGIIDLIINLLNFAWLLFRRQALTHVCTAAIFLQNIGRYLKTPPESFTIFSAEFGAALDTMLSFCLVACAIAFNFFARFNEAEKLFWNIAVIINVLGAGFSRLLISVSPAPAQPK